jgi:IS30 family transposase
LTARRHSHLCVISRTSAMSFRNTQLSVPEIARILGVAAVLEGSVRRAGRRVRITAQLVQAASDSHLWSESYDRELRDVLAMDADVAQAVANKVQVTMSGEEHRRLAAVRSISPEVYENYLKGKFASNAITNPISRRALRISMRRPGKTRHTPPVTGAGDRLFEPDHRFYGRGRRTRASQSGTSSARRRWSSIQNQRRLTC